MCIRDSIYAALPERLNICPVLFQCFFIIRSTQLLSLIHIYGVFMPCQKARQRKAGHAAHGNIHQRRQEGKRDPQAHAHVFQLRLHGVLHGRAPRLCGGARPPAVCRRRAVACMLHRLDDHILLQRRIALYHHTVR